MKVNHADLRKCMEKPFSEMSDMEKGAALILDSVHRILVDLSDSPKSMAAMLESLVTIYGIEPKYRHPKFWKEEDGEP